MATGEERDGLFRYFGEEALEGFLVKGTKHESCGKIAVRSVNKAAVESSG